MQILLPWQRPNLAAWTHRPLHPQASRYQLAQPNWDHLEITLAIEPPGPPEPLGAFERLEAGLFRYEVFGPEIGAPVLARAPLQKGDTIGLHYHLAGPVYLFFASRVIDIFQREEVDDGWRSGFIYQTLEGHPEVGEEVFQIHKHTKGAVSFTLEAWSRPNHWLVKLFASWARSLQQAAAQSASTHLGQIAVFRGPPPSS